ncbi:transcription initiation factor TFIID subunit 4-like [Microplitis mediator]|uniref:transcription initiation factor TFIID subunit 4-like n=1 Tax=Microplitis mediator TaxID=375433 RepID=UPI00255532A0|nr:transcription initiation factor TFIID subunit 4-like [Microplitis mediator]
MQSHCLQNQPMMSQDNNYQPCVGIPNVSTIPNGIFGSQVMMNQHQQCLQISIVGDNLPMANSDAGQHQLANQFTSTQANIENIIVNNNSTVQVNASNLIADNNNNDNNNNNNNNKPIELTFTVNQLTSPQLGQLNIPMNSVQKIRPELQRKISEKTQDCYQLSGTQSPGPGLQNNIYIITQHGYQLLKISVPEAGTQTVSQTAQAGSSATKTIASTTPTSVVYSIASPVSAAIANPAVLSLNKTRVLPISSIETPEMSATLESDQQKAMMKKMVKKSCDFFNNLLADSSKIQQDNTRNVKSNLTELIQDVIDDIIEVQEFVDRLERMLNSDRQPLLVDFLTKSLPRLRASLYLNQMTINGIRPPPSEIALSTFLLAPTSATQRRLIKRKKKMESKSSPVTMTNPRPRAILPSGLIMIPQKTLAKSPATVATSSGRGMMYPITAATPQTTLVMPPQTVAKPQTTLVMPPQTVTKPQTTLAMPQTTLAMPPATVVKPQTTLVMPQTTLVMPPQTVAKPQTTLAMPSATVVKPQTTLVMPPQTVAKPQTTLVMPQTTLVMPPATVAKPQTTLAMPQTTLVMPPATAATPPTTLVMPPETVAKPQTTLAMPQTTLVMPPATVAKPQTTLVMPPETVTKPQTTLAMPSATVAKPQTTLAMPPATVVKPQTTLVMPPETVAKPQTTLAMPQTTLVMPPATVAKPQTTLVMPPETVTKPQTTLAMPPATVVKPQTTLVMPQTTLVMPAETVAKPQTTLAMPQTTLVMPPATVAKPQTTLVMPPETVTKPQTTLAMPPATVVKPQTTLVMPQTTLAMPPATVAMPPTTMAKPQTTVAMSLASIMISPTTVSMAPATTQIKTYQTSSERIRPTKKLVRTDDNLKPTPVDGKKINKKIGCQSPLTTISNIQQLPTISSPMIQQSSTPTFANVNKVSEDNKKINTAIGAKKKHVVSSIETNEEELNDVMTMGGIDIAEESKAILSSTDKIGTEVRSCEEKLFLNATALQHKIKHMLLKHGLEGAESDALALVSHATEQRLRGLVEKMSTISEHRLDFNRNDPRYQVTQDVRSQLRFLQEVDKAACQKREAEELALLLQASKSRLKDDEQMKLKEKAKEVQKAEMEKLQKRDADFAALQALGPRKKPKLDVGMTSSAASGLSRQLFRPRIKKICMKDLLFVLQEEQSTRRSTFLYKSYLKF